MGCYRMPLPSLELLGVSETLFAPRTFGLTIQDRVPMLGGDWERSQTFGTSLGHVYFIYLKSDNL